MKRIFIVLIAIIGLIININCSSSKNTVGNGVHLPTIAYTKYNKRDFKGTISICTNELTRNPQNHWAYVLRGCCYLDMNESQLALNDFDSAVKIKPDNGIAVYDRGIAEKNLKMFPEAIEDFTYTIKKGNDKAHAYHFRGEIEQVFYKDYDAAQKDYDSCLALDEAGHSFIRLNKASIYAYQKKYDLAIKELNNCLKKDPQQVTSALHCKNIKRKTYELKKDYYLKDTAFIKAYSCSCDAYSVLGELYKGIGKYQMAKYYYDLGQQFSLPKANCFSGKSELELDNLQYDLALENIDSAIAYNPQNNCFLAYKGYIMKETKDYNGAMSCFEKAINCDCAKANGYLFRGETELAMGDYQKAIADVTSSINASVDSSNDVAFNLRGYVYFKNKQYKEALADYDTAIKQAKSDYQPYWEYRQEALDALNGSGSNDCTIILWQSPTDDANYLFDSARFHTNYGEPLKIILKVMTNHPITKDSVVTSVNGTPFIEDAKLTLKKNDAIKQQYIYAFEETLKLPLGTNPLRIECGKKSSQRINVVVE